MNAKKIHFKVEHFAYEVERKDLKVSIAVHDLRQKNVAEIFGISESYVSEVMNGASTKKTPRWLIISILALQFIEDVSNRDEIAKIIKDIATNPHLSIISKKIPEFKTFLDKKCVGKQTSGVKVSTQKENKWL